MNTMENWIVVFLGIIALGALAQMAFLLVLAVVGSRLMRSLAETREQVRREMHQPLAHLTEVARNLKDVSEVLSGETQALRRNTRAAGEQIREAKATVRRVARSPWIELSALAKGVARGVSAFRHDSGAPDMTPAPLSRQRG
jgi:hypothetical protein